MSSGLRYALHGDQNPPFDGFLLQYFANIIGLRTYKKSKFFVSSLYTCTQQYSSLNIHKILHSCGCKQQTTDLVTGDFPFWESLISSFSTVCWHIPGFLWPEM